MKKMLNVMMTAAICGLTLVSSLATAEEDIAALQYKLRSLENLKKKGRYVDPAEIKRLKDQVERRADEIKKTTLRSEAIKKADLPPSELEDLKKRATDFVKENAYDYIKGKVDERKAELAEKIKKAKNAREVAEFIENYTYSKDAPKNNPGLAKFYNDVYQEQGWIKRNLDRGIAEKQKELDKLSRFDSIDQGLQKVQDIKDQAQKKIDEYKKMIELNIKKKTGLDTDALRDKLGKYEKYYEQAKEMYNYVNDLKGRADAAGESVPDIPEAAKQGLRNMVYIGEALDKAAGKAPPGVSDMLEFYSDATKVSVKAAENAQKFKLGHGEIDSSNQLLSPYNDTLKQMGVDQASMTEFGKETGLRVIKADGGGYFVVDENYKIINKQGLSEEQFKNMQRIYSGFEAVRKDGEKPLTPEEIAQALAQAETGKKVVIRGEDFGENGRWLDWAKENAVEREMRKEAAGDLYDDIKGDIPPSLWERVVGRDDEDYKRNLDNLVSRWSDYEPEKLGESRKELEEKIRAGLKEGKSFEDIMQDLNGQLEERKQREEAERLKAKEEAEAAKDKLEDSTGGDADETKSSDEEGVDEDKASEDDKAKNDEGDDSDDVDEDAKPDQDPDAKDSEDNDSLDGKDDQSGSDDAEDLGSTDQTGDEDQDADNPDDDDGPSKSGPSKSARDDLNSKKDQGGKDDPNGDPAGDSHDATENDYGTGTDNGKNSIPDNQGPIEGPPQGEQDNYDPGATTVDDKGNEYKKNPDGSWEATGDKYDPITQEQKDKWNKEIEDAAKNLKDQEAASGGNSDPSNDTSDEGGSIIDNYADNFQNKQKEKNETSADNMDLNQQIKTSSTSGDQQTYDAKKTVSAAGRDAGDIRNASASKTAQKDSEDSWGNTLGDAVTDGIKQGLEDFATTFGSEAAENASNQIFNGGKKKNPATAGGASAGASPGSGGSGGSVVPSGGGKGSSGGGSGGAKSGGGGVAVGGVSQGGGAGGPGGAGAGGTNDTSSAQNDDFDKTGDSVTVKDGASAGDVGGGSANAGSSASGGFAKGHQDRTINGSGALAGKTVTGVTVNLTYQAYGIPDAFSIIYEGKSLGGTGMTSGGGTISGKSAGSSSSVTIRVLSNQTDEGTEWNWSAEVTFHTK